MSGEIKIRKFTDAGIGHIRQLLLEMRKEEKNLFSNIQEILVHPKWTTSIDEDIVIDQTKVFQTRIEMIRYFDALFDDNMLEKYRLNIGLWTWLAFAFHKSLLSKKKKEKLAAEYRWVYDPVVYRLSRQHFIAGNLYLYRDFRCVGDDCAEMFFSGPPETFGPMLDAVTYKEEFARIPALLQIATWLYHNEKNKNKTAKGASDQKKAGTIRDLTHVASQFALTYDIFEIKDASKLWNLLPSQFERFKNGKIH